MVRTQIQLPDEVFAKAKKFCEAREISLSELTRRGIEYMVEVDSLKSGKAAGWQPPKPRNLGWKGLADAEIKTEGQMTTNEQTMALSTSNQQT
jgi:hypothetical protein